MAIRTYKLTLDSKNTIAPEPVFLRQGDKTGAVVIDATLMDNGAPVSLDGLTPMFKANTADGQAVIADSTGFSIINASGGEFAYKVPSQLGAVDGKIKIAYFSFSDSSGAQSTFNVVFVVEKAADMTQESAKDWVSNLNKIIDQYNQLVNSAHSSWEDFVNENKKIIESIDPGGVLLSEITSARQDAEGNVYASIGERLDDLYHGYSDKLGLKGDVIANAVAKVANVKTDKSILKIGLINDLHFQKMVDPNWYNTATLDADHVKLYGLFANKVNAVVLNGDNVHGQEIGQDIPWLEPFSGSREVLIKRNKEIMDIANYAVPNADVFANIGNHDDGSVRWSNPLTLDELKQSYGVESFDTFKDYAKQKVRVIILNVFDNSETELKRATNSVIKQSQLDWLANTALQVPAGYATVIFTHAPLEGFFKNKPYLADWKNVNHDLVKGMLAAFIHGTAYYGDGDNGTVNVDFTSQGERDLIGIISGHEHRDKEPEVSNGIRGFMRTCSVGVGTGRILGEYSELASDLIEIDVANRTIKFNRIGYGDDLEVTY